MAPWYLWTYSIWIIFKFIPLNFCHCKGASQFSRILQTKSRIKCSLIQGIRSYSSISSKSKTSQRVLIRCFQKLSRVQNSNFRPIVSNDWCIWPRSKRPGMSGFRSRQQGFMCIGACGTNTMWSRRPRQLHLPMKRRWFNVKAKPSPWR